MPTKEYLSLLKKIEQSFLNADTDLFMTLFDIDIVNTYYTKKWFEGYAVISAKPIKCESSMLFWERKDSLVYHGKVEVVLHYQEHDTEHLLIEGLLSISPQECFIQFVECEIKLAQQNWQNQNQNTMAFDFLEIVHQISKQEESQKAFLEQELIDILKYSEDVEKASIYGRAVTKSLRYRTSNPEIDSAALIADMMSEKVLKLSYHLKDLDAKALLAILEQWGKAYLIPKTYSELRKENKNYFPAKELSLSPVASLDEIFYQLDQNGFGDVSCIEILSYYLALLALAGLDLSSCYVIVQPFHYLTAFELEQQSFIISFNDIVPMTPNRLYGDTTAVRFFNHFKYYDADGDMTNMTRAEIANIKQFFAEKMPVFRIEQSDVVEHTANLEVILPKQSEYQNADDYAYQLKKMVFGLSQKVPESIFTWVKYAYQTIFVKKPQAYIICCQNSSRLHEKGKELKQIVQIVAWMKQNIKNQSIFLECDRIMTADQVLNYQTGSLKDKANFLYTFLLANKIIEQGGIIITETISYVAYQAAADKIHFIDMDSYETHSQIIGEPLFIFNENISYNSYFDSKDKMNAFNWLISKES